MVAWWLRKNFYYLLIITSLFWNMYFIHKYCFNLEDTSSYSSYIHYLTSYIYIIYLIWPCFLCLKASIINIFFLALVTLYRKYKKNTIDPDFYKKKQSDDWNKTIPSILHVVFKIRNHGIPYILFIIHFRRHKFLQCLRWEYLTNNHIFFHQIFFLSLRAFFY